MKKMAMVWGLVMLAASAALALEGYVDLYSGDILKLKGYGNTPGEIYAAPPVVLNFNRQHFDGHDDTWMDLSADEEGRQNLFTLLVASGFAAGLWENSPHTRLNINLGDWVSLRECDLADGTNVLMLASSMNLGGGTVPRLAREGSGPTAIAEFDIHLSRPAFSTNIGYAGTTPVTHNWKKAVRLTAHELGHGLGLNHSYLTTKSDLQMITSIMAENVTEQQQEQFATQGLPPDDVEAACRLYPNHANRLSGSSGTVIGRLLNADGTGELFGGVVMLRNQGGTTVYHRISGWEASLARDEKLGCFSISGVAPGLYTLRARPFDLLSRSVKIQTMYLDDAGETVVTDSLVDELFAESFRSAQVDQIEVRAGECVDVGYVKADEIRPFSRPTLGLASVGYSGAQKYAKYWYDFWAYSTRTIVHRSGSWKLPTYAARLAPDSYQVQIYGWNGSGWVTIQPWKRLDFNLKPVTLAWARKTEPGPGGTTMEAREYEVYLNVMDAAGMCTLTRYFPVDSTSLRTYLAPGQYGWQVDALFATGTFPRKAAPPTLLTVY